MTTVKWKSETENNWIRFWISRSSKLKISEIRKIINLWPEVIKWNKFMQLKVLKVPRSHDHVQSQNQRNQSMKLSQELILFESHQRKRKSNQMMMGKIPEDKFWLETQTTMEIWLLHQWIRLQLMNLILESHLLNQSNKEETKNKDHWQNEKRQFRKDLQSKIKSESQTSVKDV